MDVEEGVEFLEAPADDADQVVDRSKFVTTKFMTKYEKARILGTRALQIRFDLPPPLTHTYNIRRIWMSVFFFILVLYALQQIIILTTSTPPNGNDNDEKNSMNAPPMVDIGDETDPLKIAM